MKFYGGMINRLEEGNQYGDLEIGMGATKMMWSDRHAYTVQKIISPKRVIVTRDEVKRIDTNGMSDCQHYEYTSTPLMEGERCKMCCNAVVARLQAQFPELKMCAVLKENGTCEGCDDFKLHTPSNGIELRLCKGGWKQVGTDTYFALGVRDEYYDYTF